MDTPEWKSMTDWSGLPDVYVTEAECQQGMFWRIEACSVPMAIGPEVRLIREDRVAALIREAEARGMERAADGLVISFLHMRATYAKEIAAVTPFDPLQAFYEKEVVWSAIGEARDAIRAAAAAHRKDEETPK